MKNTIYQNLKYKRGDKGLLKVMLKAKSEGKLTDEQIKTIIERTDLTARDLKVIDDPFEFEETSRDLDYTFHHSWAGDIRRTVATTKLVGDYNVGHDDIYEYSFNGQPVEEEQDEEIGNFSVNDVIVVKVKEGEYKDFDIMSSDDYEETSSEYILMYVPKNSEGKRIY